MAVTLSRSRRCLLKQNVQKRTPVTCVNNNNNQQINKVLSQDMFTECHGLRETILTYEIKVMIFKTVSLPNVFFFLLLFLISI